MPAGDVLWHAKSATTSFRVHIVHYADVKLLEESKYLVCNHILM